MGPVDRARRLVDRTSDAAIFPKFEFDAKNLRTCELVRPGERAGGGVGADWEECLIVCFFLGGVSLVFCWAVPPPPGKTKKKHTPQKKITKNTHTHTNTYMGLLEENENNQLGEGGGRLSLLFLVQTLRRKQISFWRG